MEQEKFNEILIIQSRALAFITTSVVYKWDNEFSMEELKNTFKKFNKAILEYDLTTLNGEQRKLLGFSSMTGNGNTLIPLHLMNAMSQDMEVVCIDGTKNSLKNANNDIRGGCIGYSIIPQEQSVQFLKSDKETED